MVRYRIITANDPLYIQEKDLRERTLRKPLGMSLSERDIAGEDGQVHIVALDDAGRVIGCVLVSFAGGQAKARQLAVDETWRGRGIGRELMRQAEGLARMRKHDRLMLHGRLGSAKFFEHLGYSIVSDVFTEVTIPHIRLEKRLDDT